MEFGAHLPLMQFGPEPPSMASLLAYVSGARDLGFDWIAANDHFVFHRPWIDGPSALAMVLPETAGMTLATTITLPVLRHPVPLAKALGTLDLFSEGRVVVGVGPGSHQADYRALGVPWEERWPRFEESISALRSMWDPEREPFEGSFYSTPETRVEPLPARAGGPPIWVGSWGSEVGLRRVARLGDGWLASAYNATPESFLEARSRLDGLLAAEGRAADGFPHAVASAFFYVTEDAARADLAVETIAASLGRSPEEARQRLLIGPKSACAERLSAYAEAGVQRMLVWPIGDDLEQIELFAGHFINATR